MHFSSPHCPKNNLNLLIKTEPGTVGAVARVYVWFLSQIHIIYTIPLHPLQYSTLEWHRFYTPACVATSVYLIKCLIGNLSYSPCSEPSCTVLFPDESTPFTTPFYYSSMVVTDYRFLYGDLFGDSVLHISEKQNKSHTKVKRGDGLGYMFTWSLQNLESP